MDIEVYIIMLWSQLMFIYILYAKKRGEMQRLQKLYANVDIHLLPSKKIAVIIKSVIKIE